MWRCEYCRKRFDDRVDCINHARARHSRDYTTCSCLHLGRPSAPRRTDTLAGRLMSYLGRSPGRRAPADLGGAEGHPDLTDRADPQPRVPQEGCACLRSVR